LKPTQSEGGGLFNDENSQHIVSKHPKKVWSATA
jgi:hypothetical protein